MDDRDTTHKDDGAIRVLTVLPAMIILAISLTIKVSSELTSSVSSERRGSIFLFTFFDALNTGFDIIRFFS